MNDAPAITAAQVDELLSAELDGEFDAAAADLGLQPDEARERLALVADVDARRDDLRAARDAVAAVDPVDEITEARWRAAAMDAFRADIGTDRPAAVRPRARRAWLYGAGAVAAACAGVFALSTAMHTSTKTTSVAASSPAPTAPATTAPGRVSPAAGSPTSVFAYGAYDAPAELAPHVASLLPASTAAAGTAKSAAGLGAASTVNSGLTTRKAYSSDAVAKSAQDQLAATPLATCAGPIQSAVGTDAVLARGTATLAGKPVAVVVVQRRSQPVMIVLRSDCTVQTKVPLLAK